LSAPVIFSTTVASDTPCPSVKSHQATGNTNGSDPSITRNGQDEDARHQCLLSENTACNLV
jgi:hypothetical protein